MSSLLTKISGGVVLEEDFAVATPAVKLMGK